MKAIATLTISNTQGLAIYDINDEIAMVGVNDESPKECEITISDDGDPIINTEWGDYSLNDFIRVDY